MDDDLIVTGAVRIPRSELQVTFSPSGGPGGQHANRSHTRVELRFDVAASRSLDPGARQRLLDRLGTEVRIVVDDERSQVRNRALAEQRLAERLRGALRVPRTRRPTRPTRASKGRRLAAKSRRSETKRLRRRPGRDD